MNVATRRAEIDRNIRISHSIDVSRVVAIPVCNERERIVDCLDALAAQVGLAAGGLGILLFLNNCTDDTRAIVDAWMPASPWPIRVIERDSPSASAGWARRQAMDAAAAWLEATPASRGLLLTTDADSRVPLDWVARNQASVVAGADAVAGRVAFDPDELASLPSTLRLRQELEATYDALLAEIEAKLAPRRGNPWPCHSTKSGASIAVTLDAYRRVGGIPPLPSGEDHALLDLIVARGLVVRHAFDIVVTTSGRLDGRARGGTSDTLRHWRDDPDSPCEPRLQPLIPFVWRLLRGSSGHARETGRALRPYQLPRQIARARAVLRLLCLLEAGRGGRPRAASLTPAPPKRLSMP